MFPLFFTLDDRASVGIKFIMRIGFNQLIPSLRASAHTGVAIRPPEALINSEIKPGRWEYGLPHQ